MVTRVAIIGVGHVGAAVAQAMVLRSSVSELILIDKKNEKAVAEQLDLSHQQALMAHTTHVIAHPYEDDWKILAGCDAIVTAAGNINLLNPDHPNRLGEVQNSMNIVEEIAPRIKASGFAGILVNITNPCDVVVTYLQQLSGIPRARIFGTGTTLDTTRMQYAVAEHFGMNSQDVSGYVLGEHGESQFVAWSTVHVAGTPMLDLADQQHIDLNALKESARLGGWKVMAGKHFTSYGIGLSATVIVEAVVNNTKKTFPLSSYNEKFGTYIGQVTRIGSEGVIDVFPPKLPENEQALFDASATIVHDNLGKALAGRTK